MNRRHAVDIRKANLSARSLPRKDFDGLQMSVRDSDMQGRLPVRVYRIRSRARGKQERQLSCLAALRRLVQRRGAQMKSVAALRRLIGERRKTRRGHQDCRIRAPPSLWKRRQKRYE